MSDSRTFFRLCQTFYFSLQLDTFYTCYTCNKTYGWISIVMFFCVVFHEFFEIFLYFLCYFSLFFSIFITYFVRHFYKYFFVWQIIFYYSLVFVRHFYKLYFVWQICFHKVYFFSINVWLFNICLTNSPYYLGNLRNIEYLSFLMEIFTMNIKYSFLSGILSKLIKYLGIVILYTHVPVLYG